MDQIINQIKKARQILLTSHSDPDGDAVSSLLALGLALSNLGKKVTWQKGYPLQRQPDSGGLPLSAFGRTHRQGHQGSQHL
jgi:nanoRNase/pAp phosphatase (c-di-AMP/oligoRNAs hydrolase)